MSASSSNRRLVTWLQLAGGAFPIGSFNHSLGLETYVVEGTVRSAESLRKVMETVLDVLANTDLIFVAEAHRATAAGDGAASGAGLRELSDQYAAIKPARETCEASAKTGRALANAMNAFAADVPALHYPVAYGAASARLGMPLDETVITYAYAALASLVSVAARLIPLGQMQTQTLLCRMSGRVLDACDGRTWTMDELNTFSSGLEVASMRHETLDGRLCMS